MEANAGKSFQMQILFNIFPRISLHCKLVSVQYCKYEYGLLSSIIMRTFSFVSVEKQGYCDHVSENTL